MATAGERSARGGPQVIPRPPGTVAGDDAPWADLPSRLRRPTVDTVVSALAAIGPARPSPVERDGFDAVSLPADVVRMAGGAGVSATPAAVIAALYDDGGEAHVVLTRRSQMLRAHAGEVSFPGGRVEPGDADLVATALREAEEEVGLDPRAVDVVGELDHLATVTSGSFIVPWVGALDRRPSLVPTSAEVDAVLEVPLSELMAPGVFREELWTLGDVRRPIVFFDLEGDTVWGATAAMLRQLLGIATGTLGRGDLGHD